MKKVGVVIVNYNDSINALKLFEKLKESKTIVEICIVDNNSKDIFKKELQSYDNDKLKIIFSSENKGYAYAMNLGAIYFMDKYKDIDILFSNTDIIVHNLDVIDRMSLAINDTVGTSMIKVKESNGFNYGWKLTSSFIDLICNIPFISRFYKNQFIYYKKDKFKNKTQEIVDCVYGCFFMVNGNCLKEIGYFDENTFLYFEENILARKLKSHKKYSVIILDDYVLHNHNQTIGTNVSRYNKYKIYKKSQFYYEKNYNNANAVEMLFFKIFYYIRLFILRISCFVKR